MTIKSKELYEEKTLFTLKFKRGALAGHGLYFRMHSMVSRFKIIQMYLISRISLYEMYKFEVFMT